MMEKELPPGGEAANGKDRKPRQNALESGAAGSRNDYVYNLYASSIPDFTLIPKVDLIKLSYIPSECLQPICDMLAGNDFKLESDLLMKRGKYRKKRTYVDGTVAIGILYNSPESLYGWQPIFILINDPTQGILRLFDAFFRQVSVFPKINQVEIAFDFFTKSPFLLNEFLDMHLFLKYQRRESFTIKTTFYSTDVRTSSKGTRTYPKKINSRSVVRLELVLNRRLIKKLRLEWPLKSLESMDFSKYFSFKFLDLQRLTNYLIKSIKVERKGLDKDDDMEDQLLMRQIESWVSSTFMREFTWKEKLMKHVEILKSKDQGIDNYGRFLQDMEDFNLKFKEAISGKRFIPVGRKIYRMEV